MLLLVAVVARDDCDRCFAVAQVHGLMRHICRNENEITGDVHDALFQIFSVPRLDTSLQQIDRGLVPLVRVGLRLAAGRNDDLQ